jgi:hypothetical protein
MCAVIELSTGESSGGVLGEVQVTQHERRGHYRAEFEEDILGMQSGEFNYGRKRFSWPLAKALLLLTGQARCGRCSEPYRWSDIRVHRGS